MQSREHLSEFCIDKLIGATLRRSALWEYRSNEGMPHRYESLLDEIERLSSYNTAWEFASMRGNGGQGYGRFLEECEVAGASWTIGYGMQFART